MTQVQQAASTLDQANAIVKKYTYWSTGLGIIPVPLVDLAAVTGSQLLMLNELAQLYKQEFSENYGKAILSSLVSGLGTTSMVYGRVGSLIKCVPFVGHFLGFISMPAFAGASTYAVGKLFIMHFESGGSFLNFDPAKVKCHYEDLFAAQMPKA